MASSVYSVRFAAIAGVNGVSTFTVPAGKVAVIKDVFALFVGSSGHTYVEVYDPSLGIARVWLDASATNTHQEWHGMQVIDAGVTFQLDSNGPLAVYAAVSGYLLSNA